MTGEAPALSGPEAPPLCARGDHPLGSRYHVGWDPKGPICDDCWYEDAQQREDVRMNEVWEDHYRFLREECGG